MTYKKTLPFALLLGVGINTAMAQQSVTASGGEASGSGGTVSYSAGQIIYTTAQGSSGSVAQGVQQPYEISVVLGTKDTEGIKLNLIAYPNPTTDVLILKSDYQDKNLTYQLFDLNGRLIKTDKLTGSETSITMGNHEDGVYLLKVISRSNEIKTFKIIKRH